MMLELDIVEFEQIKPFIMQFRLLDNDGNARLGRDDVQACVGKSLQEMQQAARKRELVMAEMSVSQRAGLSRTDTGTVYSAADLAPSGASRRHSAPVRSSKAEPSSPTVPEWSVSGDSKEDQNAVDERAMQSQNWRL